VHAVDISNILNVIRKTAAVAMPFLAAITAAIGGYYYYKPTSTKPQAEKLG